MSRAKWALLVGGAISAFLVVHAQAQAPERAAAAATPAPQAPANLAQLMKGTLYPASNVMFASQTDNPADVPWAKDPNMATDPLASVFGKWEAVENSTLTISELADLLMRPGQKCSNGVDVPVGNADWAKFVQQLRDAGMTAYAAAQTKNQDKMIEASDVMTKACGNCHRRYRERAKADRCK
jgi:hypothetical protein